MGDIEAKGRTWATPGLYLRQSMLISLARGLLDHFLPEVVYDQTTFEEAEADESVTRPQEEPGIVLSLANRLEEEKTVSPRCTPYVEFRAARTEYNTKPASLPYLGGNEIGTSSNLTWHVLQTCKCASNHMVILEGVLDICN